MVEENLQNNVDNLMGNTGPAKVAPKVNEPYTGKLKPLRTYQGDVDNAIHKTKASIITIAVAEQDRRAKTVPTIEPQHDPEIKNKFFAFAGVTLFIFGVIVVGVFYYIGTRNNTVQIAQSNSVLNYDQQVNIPLGKSRADLIQKILDQEKNYNSPANSVLYLNITDLVLPTDSQTVLQMLAPQIPASLVRNMSTSYMIGVYSFDKNQPFIILTVDNYGAGFSGMLKWESTIVADVGPIFGLDPQNSGKYVFEDESLNNKDLRIIRNSSRQTVLLYSFVDKNTVIITSNENTFNAILNKYLISKMAK